MAQKFFSNPVKNLATFPLQPEREETFYEILYDTNQFQLLPQRWLWKRNGVWILKVDDDSEPGTSVFLSKTSTDATDDLRKHLRDSWETLVEPLVIQRYLRFNTLSISGIFLFYFLYSLSLLFGIPTTYLRECNMSLLFNNDINKVMSQRCLITRSFLALSSNKNFLVCFVYLFLFLLLAAGFLVRHPCQHLFQDRSLVREPRPRIGVVGHYTRHVLFFFQPNTHCHRFQQPLLGRRKIFFLVLCPLFPSSCSQSL